MCWSDAGRSCRNRFCRIRLCRNRTKLRLYPLLSLTKKIPFFHSENCTVFAVNTFLTYLFSFPWVKGEHLAASFQAGCLRGSVTPQMVCLGERLWLQCPLSGEYLQSVRSVPLIAIPERLIAYVNYTHGSLGISAHKRVFLFQHGYSH